MAYHANAKDDQQQLVVGDAIHDLEIDADRLEQLLSVLSSAEAPEGHVHPVRRRHEAIWRLRGWKAAAIRCERVFEIAEQVVREPGVIENLLPLAIVQLSVRKLRELQIVERIPKPANVDVTMPAIAIQACIVGMFANGIAEHVDRLTIAAEIGEPVADGKRRIGAVRVRLVIALRFRELVLALLLHGRRELRRMERLAEERHRFDVGREVLLRIGHAGWRGRTACAQHRDRCESPHVSDRRARAVFSTSCWLFMMPNASRANGTAYGVVEAMMFSRRSPFTVCCASRPFRSKQTIPALSCGSVGV